MELSIVTFLSILCIAPVSSFQVMFDSVPVCNSSGFIECNLRVRKINRTTAALTGTLTHHVDLGASFDVMIELHHSPLGNNQFNLYPMKIGPMNACTFLEKYWTDYYEYVVKYAPNIVNPHDCPYTARRCEYKDWILDAGMFPPYISKGLWKMVWKALDGTNNHSVVIEILFKVYDDGYF